MGKVGASSEDAMPQPIAPLQRVRNTHDIVRALPEWPVGRQARLYGVPDTDLAAFYLPHVLVAHALHARLGDGLAGVRQLMLYGDAHRAQNMPLFAAPDCTRQVFRHLLHPHRFSDVRLVTPSPSVVPRLDPAVRRLFPTLTEEGVEVRPLRLAGLADPPDALVLLPTADPTEFELDRGDHALRRHLDEDVTVVGVSGTRAEAFIVSAYLALFGITTSVPVPLPVPLRTDAAKTPVIGHAWQVLSQVRTRPTHQRLERFGRIVDLLRCDDAFDDDLFGACTPDPDATQPYLQLVHGHWINLSDGTIHYVASVDEMLGDDDLPQPERVAALVGLDVLARRPPPTAPVIERWGWVLDVFEDAQPVRPSSIFAL